MVFVGDMLFMLDVGIVCCDFLGGNVYELFYFICKLLDLLGEIWFFMCYDYLFEGWGLVWEMMVCDECNCNIYVYDGVIEV